MDVKYTKSDIKFIKAARLRKAREKAGFRKRAMVFDRFPLWKVDTYTSHETGRREFDPEAAERYATAFNTPLGFLLAHDLISHHRIGSDADTGASHEIQSVPVYGLAAGGVWLEGDSDMMLGAIENVAVPAAAGFPLESQYARKVVGNSVSNRIRDGEYAIFVSLYESGDMLRPGALVDAKRTRGGLVEHTVKIFAGDRLRTDSAELDAQEDLPLASDEEDATVEIVGVAIGVYRPLMLTNL